MQKIKWAIIGAGGISNLRTIPAIVKEEGSELVGVMDAHVDNAKTTAEKYGVPFYTDMDEMFTSVECDAVYIATPVMCHFEQAMTCLKYKKHVLLEKPITLKSEDAKEIIDAFKNAGLQISIGYMMKFNGLHMKAKEIIASGGVGKVTDVRARFSCWSPESKGAWRHVKAISGGGAFMDLGVHCLELVEHVLDDTIVDVKSFYGTQVFTYDVDDSAAVIFRTAKGTLGYVDTNFNVCSAVNESVFELYGSLGGIVCRNSIAQEDRGTLTYTYAPHPAYAEKLGVSSEPKNEVYTGEMQDIYVREIRAFNDIIRSGKPDYTYTDRALHIQELVDRVYADN